MYFCMRTQRGQTGHVALQEEWNTALQTSHLRDRKQSHVILVTEETDPAQQWCLTCVSTWWCCRSGKGRWCCPCCRSDIWSPFGCKGHSCARAWSQTESETAGKIRSVRLLSVCKKNKSDHFIARFSSTRVRVWSNQGYRAIFPFFRFCSVHSQSFQKVPVCTL